MVTVHSHGHPLLTGGPAMVRPNEHRLVQDPVANSSPAPLDLTSAYQIGYIENLEDCKLRGLQTPRDKS